MNAFRREEAFRVNVLEKENNVSCGCALLVFSTVEQVPHLISQIVFSLLMPHLLIILHWKGKRKSKLLSDIQAVSLRWTKINQSSTISCNTGQLSAVA